MVTLSRHKPAAMSSATPQEGRGRGSNLAPDRYKPFSSQAHYQQVSSPGGGPEVERVRGYEWL